MGFQGWLRRIPNAVLLLAAAATAAVATAAVAAVAVGVVVAAVAVVVVEMVMLTCIIQCFENSMNAPPGHRGTRSGRQSSAARPFWGQRLAHTAKPKSSESPFLARTPAV